MTQAPTSERTRALHEGRGFDTIAQSELGEDVAQMGLDGLVADVERCRDLSVGEPLSAEDEHLALAFGKSVAFAGPVEVLVGGLPSLAERLEFESELL